MAIQSGFTRKGRFEEVPGCPLEEPARHHDESSCASCPFNVVSPGRPRVGCVLVTSVAIYEQALAHLRAISINDYDELRACLAVARARPADAAVSDAECDRIKRIALGWLPLVGNNPAEQQLVQCMIRLCDASLMRREPIRILA